MTSFLDWNTEFTGIVHGLMKNSVLFTSVVVCNELRLKGFAVRNHEVAARLRTNPLMAHMSYEKTSIKVQTVKGLESCFVYHPKGTSPDAFQDRDLKVV